MTFHFSKLFEQNILASDKEIQKAHLILINKFLICLSLSLFTIFAVSFNLNPYNYPMYIGDLTLSFFFFVQIFLRWVLIKWAKVASFILVTIFVSYNVIRFGYIYNTSLFFIPIFTSLPIFFSVQNDKKIYIFIIFFIFLNLLTSIYLSKYYAITIDVDFGFMLFSLLAIITVLFSLGFLYEKININLKYTYKNIEKKITKSKIMEEKDYKKLIHAAQNDEAFFQIQFENYYPILTENLNNFAPKLSPNEKKFCFLLFMKFSTKELATILNLSVRSTQTKKYNLRKKLNLDAEVELYDYIQNMNQ